MKKSAKISLIILGIFLFIPFIPISKVQGAYVGIQSGDKYQWELKLYAANWGTYFSDNLEETLGNLVPLGVEYNITKVFNDWSWAAPPQSYWPFTINAIGSEQTGQLLFPLDNSTITSTPINATAGYEIPAFPVYNTYWDDTWYIVNDTSSFLRQTLNLTLPFSTYGIMGVPFAPTNINWTEFVSDYLTVMSIKGGLYANISAVAQSNGYSLTIPALGFENNSVAINIDVTYNSNSVLTYHRFRYGGQTLAEYTLVEPSDPILTITPTDLILETDYTGESISWTATDLNPDTYSIELQGTGVVAGPTSWTSGTAITYNIPDGLAAGNYTYIITITDSYGNSIMDSVLVTVESPGAVVPPGIPGYELALVLGISTVFIIGLMISIKKKKK